MQKQPPPITYCLSRAVGWWGFYFSSSGDPVIHLLKLQQRVHSKIDNAEKFLFITSEDRTLEVSYINKNDGKDIICVPTQCGCSQGCLFCHMTGSGIPTVNLVSAEIVAAVAIVRDALGLTGEKPLLVSYMGCGEPMCNPQEVLASMIQFQATIPQVRFAMATVMPRESEMSFIHLGQMVLAHKLNLKVHLSLHFTEDRLRQRWLPSAAKLHPSLDLLRWYRDYTGNKIEVHYTPIDGVNDERVDVTEIKRCVGTDIPLKLLIFNPKEGLHSIPSRHLETLTAGLEALDVQLEVYTPPGRDIGASCGQFDIQAYKH